MYVTIIGGQAFPLIIFPGHEISSTFDDGTIARYVPSMPEFLLGLGGMAIAGLVVMVTLRVLRILPDRLDHQALSSASADAATDMT